MSKFKTGQAVKITHNGKFGQIVSGIKERNNKYSVVIRNNSREVEINFYHEDDIEHYENNCWNCNALVNSSQDETCVTCGLVICSICHQCRKGGCIPNGIIINQNKRPIKAKFKRKIDNKPLPDLDGCGSSLGKEFWESIDNMLEK